MINDKKMHQKIDVHHLPHGQQQIHRDYGLWILSSGTVRAPRDGFYQTLPRYFEFFSISHLLSGKGKLWLASNHEFDILPGQCVTMAPQVINRYGGVDGQFYEESSLRFCGPIADMLYKSGIIKTGVFDLGSAHLLLPIQQMAADPAKDAQINANIALQRLLIDIYNRSRKSATAKNQSISVIDQLLAVLKEQFERWWTVAEMAEFCGLSKDQFRRVFKQHTGLLPKLYLDRLKLQKAAEELLNSNKKIAVIAQQFAYQDCYHFSRRFKAVVGFSPREYRQIFGQ